MSKDKYQRAISYLKIDIESSKNNDSNSSGYKKSVYQSVEPKPNNFGLDKWFLPFCFIFEVVAFHFCPSFIMTIIADVEKYTRLL